MRIVAPLVCFVLVIVLRWAADFDLGSIVAPLSAVPPHFVTIAMGVAVWLSAGWLATALFQTLILQITRRRGITNKLPKLLIDVGTIVIFFCAGLLIVTQVFGQPLGGILATSGVLAALIGLSVQKTIADVAAGIGLSLEQSIKLGDWIETSSGTVGKVIEITWRTTCLETMDGHMVIAPNSWLTGGPFVNLSAPQRHLRFTKKISIDYNIPADHVMQILEAALKATPGVLAQPEPRVLIDSCDSSGVVYSMHHWVADYPENFRVSGEALANALNFLDHAGIAPNYPSTDVTLFEPTPRRIKRDIDVAAILRRVPFFAFVEDNILQAIEDSGRLRNLTSGSVVVKEGDAGDSLFLVIAGLLDVTKGVAGRHARLVGHLSPGTVFGEMSLLTGAPRSATIVASTNVTLFEIDKAQIEPILTGQPDIIAAFSQLMANREAVDENILATWPEERQKIESIGLTAFLRAKIAQFFAMDRSQPN